MMFRSMSYTPAEAVATQSVSLSQNGLKWYNSEVNSGVKTKNERTKAT